MDICSGTSYLCSVALIGIWWLWTSSALLSVLFSPWAQRMCWADLDQTSTESQQAREPMGLVTRPPSQWFPADRRFYPAYSRSPWGVIKLTPSSLARQGKIQKVPHCSCACWHSQFYKHCSDSKSRWSLLPDFKVGCSSMSLTWAQSKTRNW